MYCFASFWTLEVLEVPHPFAPFRRIEMPYVTVVFDPKKVSQETVDKLKPWLQPNVAEVLSSLDVVYGDYSLPGKFNKMGVEEDIRTTPEEIMVMQQATHPTDVNVAPLEIFIQAGRYKGRSGDKVVAALGKRVSESEIIPNGCLGEGEAGIFVNFHEHNGFGFIPKHHIV